MKNPKAWAGATPYSRTSPTDFSSSGRSEGNSSNSRGHKHPTRTWKARGDGFKPTPDSEALDAIPGSTNTHPLLGIKSEEMSGHVGDGKMKMAPKTGDKTFGADPKESMPKKWHKRGYDMAGGHGVADESAGTARKRP